MIAVLENMDNAVGISVGLGKVIGEYQNYSQKESRSLQVKAA
jgi:hypothetical protein